MKFKLKFQDLKPEVQAEIHNQIMEVIAGGKNPEALPLKYFNEVSSLTDEAIENGFYLEAACQLPERDDKNA